MSNGIVCFLFIVGFIYFGFVSMDRDPYEEESFGSKEEWGNLGILNWYPYSDDIQIKKLNHRLYIAKFNDLEVLLISNSGINYTKVKKSDKEDADDLDSPNNDMCRILLNCKHPPYVKYHGDCKAFIGTFTEEENRLIYENSNITTTVSNAINWQ